MNKILHPAATRGTANYGWLQAKYSFSFANYFDPNRLQFGSLRVLNDDVIAPGMGFGTHPHKNMEIVTIPQLGAVKHKDSMGNNGIVAAGDIQVMSAGSGVEHSEFNASTTEPLKLFQIWLFPETENVTPRYDQKEIAPLLTPNTFSPVVKPKSEASDSDLWIHQQAYFHIGDFTEERTTNYSVKQPSNGVYLMVIKGSVVIDNETLTSRDAIGLWDTKEVPLTVSKDSRLLLIEVPMN
ncbi:pirin family protein [Aureisphaera galaxeae]|uniref:pirin family protein n=1 Tax=Aureisphaera galaxeae TaxID=1538023 RepID=UPI0023509D46|nr:pirin family protein [Aureisphaera galaxeae]MDC8003634.1 pirin family protein [Aureisphaera galaxeae]